MGMNNWLALKPSESAFDNDIRAGTGSLRLYPFRCISFCINQCPLRWLTWIEFASFQLACKKSIASNGILRSSSLPIMITRQSKPLVNVPKSEHRSCDWIHRLNASESGNGMKTDSVVHLRFHKQIRIGIRNILMAMRLFVVLSCRICYAHKTRCLVVIIYIGNFAEKLHVLVANLFFSA